MFENSKRVARLQHGTGRNSKGYMRPTTENSHSQNTYTRARAREVYDNVVTPLPPVQPQVLRIFEPAGTCNEERSGALSMAPPELKTSNENSPFVCLPDMIDEETTLNEFHPDECSGPCT